MKTLTNILYILCLPFIIVGGILFFIFVVVPLRYIHRDYQFKRLES